MLLNKLRKKEMKEGRWRLKAEACGKMKKKKNGLYAAEQAKVKTWTGAVSLSLAPRAHSLSRGARFSVVSPVCAWSWKSRVMATWIITSL